MELLIVIMVFILGCCFGSFVNMMEYRLAVRYKIYNLKFKNLKNKNRSFCDYCCRQLTWYENIPIVSWLVQKGQTKCCRKKLPFAYPIVELMMGILFVINFKITNNQIPINPSNFQLLITNYQLILIYLISFIIVIFLVFSAVFDLKYMLLPDFSTVILSIAAVVLNLFNNNFGIDNIISAFTAGGFLLILYLITKGKGMGMGDVKLAFFIGLLLGWKLTIVAFYIAFIVGALAGIFLLLRKHVKKNTSIPFGPFLIIGTTICWWFGGYVINLINKWL